MTNLCPLCKHGEILHEDEHPMIKLFDKEGLTKKYFIGTCDNCFNQYCYKIEVDSIKKTDV